jgi:Mrp family chromosome partitioning ATPase
VILVATLATLFLSLGSIAAGELLNNGQATEVHAPAESAADLPDVASPALGADAPPPSHVIGVPIAAVEELARQLRAAAPAGRRVAVAGVRRQVGTTIAAITLARTLSREARVILVDLAFEAPHLAAISSDPAAPGIADLVRGTASFGQIITRDRLSRLHLIGAGQGHGATELDSPRLAMTLDALGRSYDHVVVDAGADADVVERLDPSTTKVVLIAADAVAAETFAVSERLRSVGHEDPALLVAEPLVAPSFARTAA